MSRMDKIANALRLEDALLRGGGAVVPWERLQESERERWRHMARVAQAVVLSG